MHIIIEDPAKRQRNKKQKIPPSQSQNFIAKITNKSLEISDFLHLCNQDPILQTLHLTQDSLEFLQTVGMDLILHEQNVFLGSKNTNWEDQLFCFVDIETTHANPLHGNLLEIGAILCKGSGEVCARFESLVYNQDIPLFITEITGIATQDVSDAPSTKEVLKEFREFIKTSVFVAHNVNFDYCFLDFLYCKHFGIGLYNQTLCTLKMAKKIIQAPKYNLAFLNDFLGISTPISHRAYADALTCKEIFLYCSASLPSKNTQNILNWLNRK